MPHISTAAQLEARSSLMRARTFIVLLPLVAACKCGGDRVNAPEDIKAMFEQLFAKLPAAKIAQPIDAVPKEVSLVASSPDPEAWRAWAEKQPFAQAMMKTPLFEDLRLSRAHLQLDGLRQQVSRVSTFIGKKEDLGAIWRGPTAAGVIFGDERGKDQLLLIKRIDPSARELVRFAAAFALAAKPENGDSKLSKKTIDKLDLYTLERRTESVSFVLFRDLLVAGTDANLVERAAKLAAGEDDGASAAKSTLGRVLPPPETAGVHLAFAVQDNELAKMAGVEAIGVSLVADPAQPLLIRRTGGSDPGPDALALLRYAPADTFVALVDGAKASDALLASVEVPDEIKDELRPGVALIFGPGGATLALTHSGKRAELEMPVRKLLAKMTGRKVDRLVLEDKDNAVVLSSKDDGPCAAITKNAILFALDPERLRTAIAAGAAKAPSLADRQGVDLAGTVSSGVFVDLAKGSAFLTAYYKDAVGAADADAVLTPTFAALAQGGAFFGRVEAKGDGAQGALHALP